MKTARVVAVCRVHQLLPDAGTVGVTGIDKRPVEGPLRVRRLGVHGDVQADRANHGGEDKAVYAYSEDDAALWASELGRDIPAGYFGENLRVAGITASNAVIGERWRFSTGMVLEVTMPRIPCATFARRMGEEGWVSWFTRAGLSGAYLRVVTPGDVEAGTHFNVEHVPDHGVRVGDWLADPTPQKADALLDAEAEGAVRLAPALRAYVVNAAARAVDEA
ncbi:MOSC domain-containing protein [Sinomonas cellulolyticus]|uniref:MOSC domain-containing protein n=1 Tax=Sinomonas cellulolyticus TaxID=2801916 RepID=A0ABS1JYH0_9MICC|nr:MULTISPECIES: MOSC domain-containing protein [Sinomonas]MBL0704248.1 MOSC domain-containing protein [Sinomonas cellulolyticus]GHG58525.1 MOSC domain-containing protein [Sinomonas sp. KCTC 49339]